MSGKPNSDEALVRMNYITRKMKSSNAFVGLKHIIQSTKVERTTAAERFRRNRMQYFCTKLQSLLPLSLSKGDRSSLLDAAGNHIKELEEQLRQLRLKRECFEAKVREGRVEKRGEMSEVDVEMNERECVIIIRGIRRPRWLWRVNMVVEQHGLDVNISHLSSTQFFVYLFVHANFKEHVEEVNVAQIQNSLKARLLIAY